MSRCVPFSYSSFIAFHGVVHREPNVPSAVWTGLTLFEGRGGLLKKGLLRLVAREATSRRGGCERTVRPWWQPPDQEAMLPAAAVSGGLCKEVLEAWDAGSHVSRQRDFGGSNGVGASQVMAVGALEPEVVHQPRLAFTDLATQGNHAEDDELVARGGIPSVVVRGCSLVPSNFSTRAW